MSREVFWKKSEKNDRESGILLPLSALPGTEGIGTLGEEAYRFIDFLKAAHQRYWQMLPLTPVGEGNSPYSSMSAFAGEILYINLELLGKDGYLPAESAESFPNFGRVDYDALRKRKLPLLRQAAQNFSKEKPDYKRFLTEQKDWVFDYALFCSISEVYGVTLSDFPEGLKYRLPDELARFEENHADTIDFYLITQYFFFTQYFALRRYAQKKGIALIGDLPFYVQQNSADVWTAPQDFKVGRDFTPLLVSGAPPDAFSEEGQIWNNPVYDFGEQKKNGYRFWKHRLSHASMLYDVIRLDHFRAFSEYYVCAYGAKNAKAGSWEKGVGFAFFEEVRDSLTVPVIAEDLGGDTDGVRTLLSQTGFPPTRVLEFAFDGDLSNPHWIDNYDKNTVCYTGTHDNDTLRGWLNSVDGHAKTLFTHLMGTTPENADVFSLIRVLMACKAETVIVPLQDYLNLDSAARFNIPGKPTGNWVWRVPQDALSQDLAKRIKDLSPKRN